MKARLSIPARALLTLENSIEYWNCLGAKDPQTKLSELWEKLSKPGWEYREHFASAGLSITAIAALRFYLFRRGHFRSAKK